MCAAGADDDASTSSSSHPSPSLPPPPPSFSSCSPLTTVTNLFPVWVLAGAAVALAHPPAFTWFSGDYIMLALSAIMLCMGLTLRVDEFAAVARRPRPVLFGAVAQYTLMPLLGLAATRVLRLPRALAVGTLLVASCPGGTASNLVCYIGRADVALSVLMTLSSTIASVFMTPLLMKVLAGTLVPVDALALWRSTLRVVLAPLALGLAINAHPSGHRVVRRAAPILPLVSVLAVVLINGSVVARSAVTVRAAGGRLLAALALLHGGGFALGYVVASVCGYDKRTARTVCIEVGMQNSGLGAALAQRHFAAAPSTAVPAAISATMHSVLGSVLAGYWRGRDAAAHFKR